MNVNILLVKLYKTDEILIHRDLLIGTSIDR